MKSVGRRIMAGVMFGVTLTMLTAQAAPTPSAGAATTIVVNDDAGACGAYTTTDAPDIAAGVAMLPASGGTVAVCPGVYPQFVLNNLTGKVTIKAAVAGSASMPTVSPTTPGGGTLITVENSKSVILDGLIIDGAAFNDTLSSDARGVMFHNSSGVLQNNKITALRNYPNFYTGASGYGISVLDDNGDGKVSSVTIKGNSLTDIETYLVHVSGPVKATLSGNYMLGNLTQDINAENGIVFLSGATGSISKNIISKADYAISLNGVSKIAVTGNDISNSAYAVNISAFCSSGYEQANANKITGNTLTNVFRGVIISSEEPSVCGPHTDNNVVSKNVMGGKGIGIGVDMYECIGCFSEKNKITGNTIFSFLTAFDPDATDNTVFTGNKILP